MALLWTLALGVLAAAEPAVSELEASKGRQLTVVRVRTCPTARLGGELPIPLIGTISGALPEPDAIRPRFQAMERQMRSVPGWQPLEEPQAVLPTALEMPQDAALAARRIDALIVGVLTVGLAVLAASVPVALVSLLAPTGPPSRGLEEKTRLLEAGAGEVAQEQKDEEEFEMQLGPLKTVVFAVYYVCNILFLLVLTSWSKADNLMLGGAGLAWEIIWLWLVVVLATDVVGYLFRAVQAAWMKRQISVTDPAISIVMSVFPVLGPRVDLLKDCLFAGAVFQLAACQAGSWRRTAGFCLGNAALLTIFLPAPALFRFETTRRDLAAEFWPALVARLRVKKAGQRERPRGEEEQTTWEWLLQKAEGFVVPKLVAQCTQSRLWTALGEDLPQAILAIVAMVVFEQYSGVLLVNLVISGGKIAAVFSLREFIWGSRLFLVDPVTCAAFAASLGQERSCEALIDVAKRGLADHVAALVSAGADKAKDESGGTPLHLAAYQGHAACVDLLLKAGADKNLLNSRGSDVRTSVGMTPLHVAADNGHAACVELLLKAGAEKDVQGNVYGGTPLHLAAREGHAACVELLLKAGAEKDVQNNVHGGTPLLWAAGKGHAACVEVLLMAGAEKDVQNVHGEPPLYQAAFGGHAECVDLLLKAGAQKDVQNEYGMTPLHGAALPGHPDCVDLLLKAGADKDVQHSAGGTPLHVAAERGHAACVEVLLKAGAKKGLKDRDGDTALDLAREKGRRDYSEGRRACISLLEEAGARGSRDGFLSWMLK